MKILVFDKFCSFYYCFVHQKGIILLEHKFCKKKKFSDFIFKKSYNMLVLLGNPLINYVQLMKLVLLSFN